MNLEFIGKSKASLKLLKQLEILSSKKVDVLLIGERGSGRDFCAKFLEANLQKIDSEFWEEEIKKLKQVENLYIDNLEFLGRYAQTELLRILENRMLTNKKPILGRILFSSTPEIFKKIEQLEFRKDLFQRIHAVRIEIPSLIERREDIFFFVDHFLKKLSQKHKKKISSLTKKLIEFIQNYSWQGNLLELELFLETQVLFSKKTILDLYTNPSPIYNSVDIDIRIGLPLREYEKKIILANLKYFHGNRSKTAKALGISERNLYRKLKEYGLK
ncbi:MAG: sigma 54-interacting transcriptional regulator [Leptospiraceae bacterium]|nr:sigma 54-interacting transcriptional regulator [Leptospiraceae bacterium]